MSSINYNKAIANLSSAISNLNDTYKMQMNQLYGSSSIDINTFNGLNKIPYVGEGNRLLTIKNPERLNTEFNKSISGWMIEYMGRDLSLNEDNYRWDIEDTLHKVRGYYIIERGLINNDWLNVRWNRIGLGNKEVRELIDKKRLKDKSIIQRDMITAIIADINTIK
jgi:hypothetical protein